MVDMERDVPGKTAEKDLAPADPDRLTELMSSIFQVWMRLVALRPAASDFALSASTSHITIRRSAATTNMEMSSKCLPITLVSRNDGTAVTTKRNRGQSEWMGQALRLPLSPLGNVDRNFTMRPEIDWQTQDAPVG